MKEEVHIDEDDANRVARVFIPFFLFFILSLYFAQYWENLNWNEQMAIIVLLALIAAIVYRKEIGEMVFK